MAKRMLKGKRSEWGKSALRIKETRREGTEKRNRDVLKTFLIRLYKKGKNFNEVGREGEKN